MEAGNMKRLVRTLVCIVLCMLAAGCSAGNPSMGSGPVFQSIGAVEIPPSNRRRSGSACRAGDYRGRLEQIF